MPSSRRGFESPRPLQFFFPFTFIPLAFIACGFRRLFWLACLLLFTRSLMETIRIAVGSKRAPKVEAVREALESLGPLLRANAAFDVAGFEVATGVSHTPLSREELMAGARGRCEAVMRASGYGAEAYFVGLEGGLDVVRENGRRLAFLQSWAFVADAERARILRAIRRDPIAGSAGGGSVRPRRGAFPGDRGVHGNDGRARFARRLGRSDEGPDRSAGVVSDRGDQRVCAVFQCGDVWALRGRAKAPLVWDQGQVPCAVDKPNCRSLTAFAKGATGLGMTAAVFDVYRLLQLAANYKVKAQGPQPKPLGRPGLQKQSQSSEVRTYLLNQPIVSAQACVAASGL